MPFNEADTRAKLIDPGLHGRGWTEDLIRREETAGAIEVIEGQARKRSKGRVDYVLRVKLNPSNQGVAVALIEAKSENLPPDHGLEQAKAYAKCRRFNVQFVYSSNGHLFVEYDLRSGRTTAPKPLTLFPSPNDLQVRYESAVGFKLADPQAKPLLVPYHGGEATRRYYQDAAIRAALEKIARCEKSGEPKRVLLSLATGSGKTFIAVNLLRRIADAGQLQRALFVCDRDELRSQGLGALNNAFGSDAAEVYEKSDGKNNAKNARVHVATYQTLNVDQEDATAGFLAKHYPLDYFSHIVIDECHRSAWGKWSEILTRNPKAVQVGLTATPRHLKMPEDTLETKADAAVTADNLKYFGEPVYEYDMSQGWEDGYLAPCEVLRFDLFHDNKALNERDSGVVRDDLTGKHLSDAMTGEAVASTAARPRYEASSLDDRLLMPDRVAAMTQDLFKHFLETGGPEQKTIIFCARDVHAERVAIALNNLYADWCAKNNKTRAEPYAFKCTAASGGNEYLADLRGASRHHFIATTVELLTTGVDVPCVRNIVFFKYVRSPLSFYQMVGRGTRLDPASEKLMFRVYDYTDATRLFGKDFTTKPPTQHKPGEEGPSRPPEPLLQVEGFEVRVNPAGRYILTQVDGKAMPVTVEDYKERLAAKLVEEARTLEEFRGKWIVPPERRELLEHLPDGGRSATLVRALEDMKDYDLYDVLADLGYGLSPRTRHERAEAFNYKHANWLATMPPKAANTLKAVATQFSRAGTEGLENPQIFQTPEVREAGGLPALQFLAQSPADILLETKQRMFAA